MSEYKPIIHISENSPEHIAYRLLERIAALEGKSFRGSPQQGRVKADRAWVLDTYAECLETVRGLRSHRAEQDD
jgi:hypothetical protein